MLRQKSKDLKIQIDRLISLEAGRRLAKCDPGEEIVISGYSGSFPNSNGLPDLANNIFNKVNLISDDDRRWTNENPKIPHRTGKLNQVNKFDAAFFGIHYKQAHIMDPMCRIILEKTYEAIVDSGNSPKSLKGSKTGVFIGASYSESEKNMYTQLQLNGFGLTGCLRVMLANRISYWLGINGTVGRVGWLNNWVAFMDNILQMQILNENTRLLCVPKLLQKLSINVEKHNLLLESFTDEKPEIPVYLYPELKLIISGGVEFRGLQVKRISKRKPLTDPVLEKYMFIPNIIKLDYTFEEILRISLDLVMENIIINELKIIKILPKTFNPDEKIISSIVLDLLANMPLIQPQMSTLSDGNYPQLNELRSHIKFGDKKLSAEQSVLLVIASEVLGDSKLLDQVFATLKPGGFLLTREQFNSELSIQSVDICLDAFLEHQRILLVRKPLDQDIIPMVIKISSTEFSWISELQKILKYDNCINQKIILVSEKEPKNGIIGLFNCIRKEYGGERIRCVFITDESAPNFSLNHPLYKTQLKKDLALNVYKNKIRGSYRNLLLKSSSLIEVQHAYVDTNIRGDLSSLQWLAGSLVPNTQYTTDESKTVHVYYTGLNINDIMLATAKLCHDIVAKSDCDLENTIGIEYSGRTETGNRVMGMVSSRGLTNLLNYDPFLLWKVPDHWSLEDAATVLVVYGIIIYALVMIGRMERVNSILIHAGSGGVGQAAINLALSYGCTIFTTVGTPDKKEFIKTHFPQIPENHIGNSRDTSFEKMIIKETNGIGVDMVLNSLHGEIRLASVRCLVTGGRFLELSKFDLSNNIMLGMEVFLKHISFHGIMLNVLLSSPEKLKLQIQSQVQERIDSGAIKPLVRTVFESDQVEHAFKYLSMGKHIGKVLVKIRQEEGDRLIRPLNINKMAYPRVWFDNKSSCIICGGLGGFGLELADWMVLRKARNIVLVTRTGIRNGYQEMKKRVWESYGTKVVISTADITTEEGVKDLFNEANKLGPVFTIFNLAVEAGIILPLVSVLASYILFSAINIVKMMDELDVIINELIQSRWAGVKGAIMYGADENFCSGGDQQLTRDTADDPDFGYAMTICMNNVLEKFKNLPMITVAFINGSGALGGGAELTTSCDYRLMCNEINSTTVIGFVQAKMGMVPAWGSIGRLISIVGYRKALDILLESRLMGAAEAMDAGLVDGTVNTLTDAVGWLSRKIRHDVNVVKATKRTWLCYDGGLDWQTATLMERKIFASLWSGPAHQLAVQRFAKK